MNPKNVNDLDPKLKETYERVMGTSFSSAPAQTPQPQQPLQTVVEAAQPPLTTQMAQSAMETPMPTPDMTAAPQMQQPQMSPAFTQTVTPPPNVMVGDATLPAKKKKNFLMPVLFVVGGIIFFVAYAVIWAKVFGLF